MAANHLRAIGSLSSTLRLSHRALTTSARRLEAAVPAAPKTETSPAAIDEAQPKEVTQAPNRLGVWSRSQKPRVKAMMGPRFEQTDFDLQVCGAFRGESSGRDVTLMHR